MQHLQTEGITKLCGIGAAMLMLASLPALAQETGPDTGRQQELQQMLHQNCTVCHGHTFEGGAGPALTVEALAAKDEQMLVTTILQGRPGTAMPSWAWMLKEEEARWLVKFLRNGGG